MIKPIITQMIMKTMNQWIAAAIALSISLSLGPLRAAESTRDDESHSMTIVAGALSEPVEAPLPEGPIEETLTGSELPGDTTPDDPPTSGVPDSPEGDEADQNDRPEPPQRPEMPGLSGDLKSLIEEFQINRDQYLAMIREVQNQFNQAAEEDRETLRELLKAKREEFIRQQKARSMEIRERLQELREELANHRELIDAAREHAQEAQRRRGGGAE